MNTLSQKRPHREIRVLVFSRYLIARESLACMLSANADLVVASTYPVETMPKSFSAEADVAVIDFCAGDRIQLIAELREAMPEIRVIALIDAADLESQSGAVKLGAVGIVQKDRSASLLIEAIRQTYKGETWLNQALLGRLMQSGAKNDRADGGPDSQIRGDHLTRRELEVIAMIGKGLKNKEIAVALSISEATVRHHLSTIYGKIGVDDRLNLVIFAYQKGLLKFIDDQPPISSGFTDAA